MFIRTERLFLRPGWAEDSAEFARAIGHPSVTRMLARPLWSGAESDPSAFLEAVRHPHLPVLLITLPAQRGRIIGGCCLHRGDGDAVETSYWITPDCWGNGFAAEALGGLLCAARAIGHRRLTARSTLDNPASAKVLRRAGFQPTGQIGSLRSLGHATEVHCADYLLDLVPACPLRPDWTMPESYAAGIGAAA